ncbi:AMP binding protein [Phlebopus sp. FC_14]|nr:AMP binding protein [Phlebopus sp. FC_14]
MSDNIFTSPFAPVPLFQRSVFTHLLGISPSSPGFVGQFPAGALAFIDAATGATISRGALRSYALQFAHSLHNPPAPLAHQSNSSSPPTILIFAPNSIVWPIMLLGSAAAGFRATLANSAYSSAELAYQYTNAGAHLIFVHPSLLGVVQAMLKSCGCTDDQIRARIVLATSAWLTGVSDLETKACSNFVRFENLLGRGELPSEVSFEGPRSNQTQYLCYSSGTTGKPKGVETTHYNLISLVEIVKPAWPATKPCFTSTLPAERHGYQPDVLYSPLPYYHMYGAVKILLLPLVLGAPVIVTGAFDPVRFCEAVEKYRASIVFVVPPMFVVFARHEAIDEYNLTSMRVLFSGAAPLGAGLVAAVRNRLSKVGANVAVMQGYGLTEASPTITILPVEHAHAHVGSVGLVLPNLDVRLVREDEGEVLTDIEGAGELWVRGPTVMKGYLHNPTATAATITRDGWLKTGDIAVRDAEGFITIVDRRKELIKYKGFQGMLFAIIIAVPPAELESVLLQHPEVADAAVIGIESQEEATELPRAYIVPSRQIPAELCASFAIGVQGWVAERVAPHKRLRGGIILVDAIPKSAAGKILRRELRERAKTEVGHGEVKARAKM